MSSISDQLVNRKAHSFKAIARLLRTPVHDASLSGKRSLDGQPGQCPRIDLFDGFSDNKIGGRINGQKGRSMALIGYARVSTAEQDTALQTDALRKAGCERIFDDTVSGDKADRPGLTAALAFLRLRDRLRHWLPFGRMTKWVEVPVGEAMATATTPGAPATMGTRLTAPLVGKGAANGAAAAGAGGPRLRELG